VSGSGIRSPTTAFLSEIASSSASKRLGRRVRFAGSLEVSLAVPDSGSMIALQTAALVAGGPSLDGPGIREERNCDCYGARIADFDGDTIEAVCRRVTESTWTRAAA
jgi:hypothetical protein